MLENAILEHAAALNNLADAIRGLGQLPLNLSQVHAVTLNPTPAQAEELKAAVEKPKKAQKEETSQTKVEEVGPFYWEDTETQFFGKEDSIRALNKQLGTKDTIKRINEDRFNELKADLQARNEEAKAKMDAEKNAVVPTVEDVIACFTKYLPKDLDAEERKARHAVVKPLLAKFGADKATNLKPEHRSEAIAFIESKLAELDDEVV